MPRIWANVWIEDNMWRAHVYLAPWWRPFWPTHSIEAKAKEGYTAVWTKLTGEDLPFKVSNKCYAKVKKRIKAKTIARHGALWDPIKKKAPLPEAKISK